VDRYNGRIKYVIVCGPGMKEHETEQTLLEKLADLKYRLRTDIKDRATLEANFREKFEALNRVTLSDNEFNRLPQTLR